MVINRLQLGHTGVTHGYLFYYEGGFIQQPMCHWCEVELLSIRHMLVEFPSLENVRGNILKSALGEKEVSMRDWERYSFFEGDRDLSGNLNVHPIHNLELGRPLL